MVGYLVLIYGTPILILTMLIRFILKKKRKENINLVRDSLIFVFVIYIFMLAMVTLFPIHSQLAGNSTFENMVVSINYIPIKQIVEDFYNINNGNFSLAFSIKLFLRNVGGNILLLVPLAMATPLLWKRFRNLKSILLLGVITSLSIETLQFLENYFKIGIRTVDIDDVILNTLGIAIGYSIFLLLKKVANKYKLNIIKSNLSL